MGFIIKVDTNASTAIKGLNDFDVDKSKTLKELSVDKNFNLLTQELSCPPITASVKIDVDAKANALATIGVAASGTIIPPKVEDFAVITSMFLFTVLPHRPTFFRERVY